MGLGQTRRRADGAKKALTIFGVVADTHSLTVGMSRYGSQGW